MPTVRWSELRRYLERSVAQSKDSVAPSLSSRTGIHRLSLEMTGRLTAFARSANRRHNRHNKFSDAIGQILGVSNLSN